MQRTEQPEMFFGAKRNIFQNAYDLRHNMTEAEKVLWNRLNKNQLGVRFKAQHPIDIFIVDFYCHKYKLGIEVDGKIHEQNKEYDEGRTAELKKWGITTIRFTNDEVINNIEVVVESIKQLLSFKINESPAPFR